MTKQEIQIRKALPQDAEQLADLAQRSMPGYPFESIYNPAELRQEIVAGVNRIVAVRNTDNKAIVGTAVLGDGHMAEIKRVLVDPIARKQGLGAGLTTALKNMATENGVIPWADVRADQIGMQKAAHRYYPTLTPISVEMGKHIVYAHPNNTGPARESMVHMSGLSIADDKESLAKALKVWSPDLANLLVNNMLDSLITHDKHYGLVREILPSVKHVKERIEHNIISNKIEHTKISPDLVLLSDKGASCVVITPDASGFIEGESAETIDNMIETAMGIGLQIVTCYLAITDRKTIYSLIRSSSGLTTPAMIRPWQKSKNHQPEWQVGLRRTSEDYPHSLHSINLDPYVHASIMGYIEIVNEATKLTPRSGGCF